MTTRNALFVDMSNFSSRLIKSGMDEERVLRDYILDWLDLDLLAYALTVEYCDVWVFYSAKGFGPSGYRIRDSRLRAYIDRINRLRGVTARDVNIPGEQREPAKGECPQCHNEVQVEMVSEKGVDASLIVHMFDTLESWDIAYLLSGDADYVPAVSSLRRRGKIVIGVGFADASPALVRECYDYVDLADLYLAGDVGAYLLFKPDGVIHRWFTAELRRRPGSAPPESEVLQLRHRIELRDTSRLDCDSEGQRHHVISLASQERSDFAERNRIVTEFRGVAPAAIKVYQHSDSNYSFACSDLIWAAAERHLSSLVSSITGLALVTKDRQSESYSVEWEFDANAESYHLKRT